MNLKRYRDLAFVLLALAIPFWVLRASMKDPQKVSGPDRIIVRVGEPIQWVAGACARYISGIWGDYIYLVDVKEDNTRLASQNGRLQERVRKLESFEEENRRLKRLLDLKNSLRSDVVSAQVTAKNTNEFFRVARVTLDRPIRDVGANLPVLSADGVVGTTMAPTNKSSGDMLDVRLVVDAGSGIDAVVQRTGARGFVRGTGDERKYVVNVEYMQRTDEVEVGDLLVTSGMGRRFPKGVPVGTVTQVVRRDFGIYQQVLASPAVDFSRLEEVLIVTGAPADEPQPAAGAAIQAPPAHPEPSSSSAPREAASAPPRR